MLFHSFHHFIWYLHHNQIHHRGNNTNGRKILIGLSAFDYISRSSNQLVHSAPRGNNVVSVSDQSVELVVSCVSPAVRPPPFRSSCFTALGLPSQDCLDSGLGMLESTASAPSTILATSAFFSSLLLLSIIRSFPPCLRPSTGRWGAPRRWLQWN